MPLPLPQPSLTEAPLLLRRWRREDDTVLLAAGNDRVISRYRYSLPRTPDAAHEWIALTESDREDDKRLELALAVEGEPLGSVSLTDFDHGNAMVRYWLLPQGRGRGLATTAVQVLAGSAFSTLAIGRLAAYVEIGNTASGAVLERCGFVCEGRLRQHMADHDGKRVDTLLYGLLPEDLPG
ncbi:MAG: GNAT family N-acetyltransferase [Acidimicrobiales bacterium]